jgi:hypothetical protein
MKTLGHTCAQGFLKTALLILRFPLLIIRFAILTYLILTSSPILLRVSAANIPILIHIQCRSFPEAADGKETYLYKDYSVDCDSSRYKVTRIQYEITHRLLLNVTIICLFFTHTIAFHGASMMYVLPYATNCKSILIRQMPLPLYRHRP